SAGTALVVSVAILWEPLRGLLRFAVPPAAGVLAAVVTAAAAVLLGSAVTGALERGRDRTVHGRAEADRTG
ncbi:MAG TPA: hypothetical protein VGF26_25815, partial [Ramlibacter sp.]